MKNSYTLTGMTCGGCVAKVKAALLKVDKVEIAIVDKSTESVELTSNQTIPLSELQKALSDLDSKYTLSEKNVISKNSSSTSWFSAYKPILLVFFYIILMTSLVQFVSDSFDLSQWMRHFMAGFFLVFSFFKMLDLSGFANSYISYDIIAKRWKPWAYAYAFIELGLGIAYLLNCCPLATNITAFVIMSISIIGVLESVINKREIQCACLGAVFELPMSTITIIEDALMIVMSGWMIWSIIGA